MKASSYDDPVLAVTEALVKCPTLTRDREHHLTDRYSERKETLLKAAASLQAYEQ